MSLTIGQLPRELLLSIMGDEVDDGPCREDVILFYRIPGVNLPAVSLGIKNTRLAVLRGGRSVAIAEAVGALVVPILVQDRYREAVISLLPSLRLDPIPQEGSEEDITRDRWFFVAFEASLDATSRRHFRDVVGEIPNPSLGESASDVTFGEGALSVAYFRVSVPEGVGERRQQAIRMFEALRSYDETQVKIRSFLGSRFDRYRNIGGVTAR